MTVLLTRPPQPADGWWGDLAGVDPTAPAVHLPRLGHRSRAGVWDPADGIDTVSRGELAELVRTAAAPLAGERRLVLVRMTNRLPALVGYLAAHAAGHVVLLAPDTAATDALAAAWRPDVEIAGDGTPTVHRDTPRAPLHPDLALLMGTSGSSGSPRLVRLSYDNLRSNASSIAAYLAIQPADRALTSLPLHYCYGLSVVHSHLLAGASVVLTDYSVADTCFWRLASDSRATTLAGVPHTFELLDRVGFADLDLTHLRTVTQAGGRLDPQRVVALAELGQRRGFDLFVMYGQTEATARMTYLPPAVAATHPTCVGVPVPGGHVKIEDGEVVYTGPNVMLGYADTADDLALGRTTTRLRTGDLGRMTPDGLLEITGRRSRVAKVLGHRVDLDHVERALRAIGHHVRTVDAGETLGVVARERCSPRVAATAAAAAGVPTRRVHVATLADLGLDDWPLRPSGKIDHRRLGELFTAATPDTTGAKPPSPRGPTQPAGSPRAGSPQAGTVRERYAVLLDRPTVQPTDTFASLGGDSLSYVEVSLHVEEVLGHLPPAWHVTPVGDLDAAAPHSDLTPAAGHAARWWQRLVTTRSVETTLVLRAIAILLIIGTHAKVFTLQGTAHALLLLVGLNLARFRLGDAARRERARGLLRALRRVVAPALVVLGAAHVLTGQYAPSTVALANWVFGEATLGPNWRFWFVEAVVVGIVVVTAVVATPWGDRLERRHPFELPLVLAGAGMLIWYEVIPLPVPHMHGSAASVLWLFCLGWAAGKAASVRERLVVTAAVLPTVGTFSGNPRRDLLTVTVVMLALWLPTLTVPRVLVPALGVLAAASLHIYVIHWQVLQELRSTPWLAFIAGTVAGVGYWWLWTRGPAVARAGWAVVTRRSRRRRASPFPERPVRRRVRAGRG
ncbi:MAG: AMP-binding protein [Dermatophilaceae bacterium]